MCSVYTACPFFNREKNLLNRHNNVLMFLQYFITHKKRLVPKSILNNLYQQLIKRYAKIRNLSLKGFSFD